MAFIFYRRKRSGLIWSNFIVQNVLAKTCLSYQVLSEHSKNVIFLRMTIRNAKKCVFKSDGINLTSSYHYTAKSNYIALQVCAFVVHEKLCNVDSFIYIFESLFLIEIYL